MNAASSAPDSIPGLPSHLRVLRTLGEGGTAVVYEGVHERLRVPVAIKLMRAFGPAQAELRQRLLQEAELCARLNDPHVPRIYDVDSLPDGTPYLVMELIRGQGLDAIIAAGGLCYPDAAWLLGELLDALEALHEAGIVHRDIKPENLLLQRDGDGKPLLRLIDFGVAKVLGADLTSPRLTQTGTLVGTPHYIAPEVLMGQPADQRADIYAAAVTFYELLAGSPPFDDSSVGAALAASLRDEPRSLCALRPDLSPEVERFVFRGMARDPALRFRSAEDMRRALHDVSWETPASPFSFSGASLSTVAPLPVQLRLDTRIQGSGIVRRRRRRWSWLRWALPLLVVVATGYALKLLSGSETPTAAPSGAEPAAASPSSVAPETSPPVQPPSATAPAANPARDPTPPAPKPVSPPVPPPSGAAEASQKRASAVADAPRPKKRAPLPQARASEPPPGGEALPPGEALPLAEAPIVEDLAANISRGKDLSDYLGKLDAILNAAPSPNLDAPRPKDPDKDAILKATPTPNVDVPEPQETLPVNPYGN